MRHIGSPEALRPLAVMNWTHARSRDVNEAVAERRPGGRRAGLEGKPADQDAPTADDHAELALRREVVREALTKLDGRERDLLSLKFSGGLSNAEIGRVLGVSESNAGTRLHRALTKLRKACDDAS